MYKSVKLEESSEMEVGNLLHTHRHSVAPSINADAYILQKRFASTNKFEGQRIVRYWILILFIAAGFCLFLSHVHNFVSTQPPIATVRISNIFNHRNTQRDEDGGLGSIIGEDDICNKATFLLIAVCVSSSHFKQRSVIRNTWGSIVRNNDKVKLAFFIGNPNDTKIQQAILDESEHYHDIVQDNFVDSYRNLTLKSIFILKWSSTFCVDTSYVLKADDDMFINVPYLIKYLNTTNIHNAVIGQRIAASKPIRNKTSKWFTSERMYQDKYYPYYTSGTSYVISGDIVSKLYQSTFIEPFFWLEDVYITGLCRKRINASIIDNWDFSCLYRPLTVVRTKRQYLAIGTLQRR